MWVVLADVLPRACRGCRSDWAWPPVGKLLAHRIHVVSRGKRFQLGASAQLWAFDDASVLSLDGDDGDAASGEILGMDVTERLSGQGLVAQASADTDPRAQVGEVRSGAGPGGPRASESVRS